MDKLPSFQFYPGDWLKDPGLRRCSPGARGVWMDMMCLMFECEQRGILSTGGTAWPVREIATCIAGETNLVVTLIEELLRKSVASRDDDRGSVTGVASAIFSRRLLRDERKRLKCVIAGHLGGNPALTLNRHGKGEDKGPPKQIPTPSTSTSSSKIKSTARFAAPNRPYDPCATGKPTLQWTIEQCQEYRRKKASEGKPIPADIERYMREIEKVKA